VAASDYVWCIPQSNEELIQQICEAGNVSRPTALILAARHIPPSEVTQFLQPSLRQLSDPYLLPGTREAAERLWRAVEQQETILIHGDYDTDGITSAVLLSWMLESNGARTECFLPHRLDDGYGLTPESIEKACTEHHSLLVTVDCGVTSCDAAHAARERGLDVIVTDHHEPGAQLPDAVAVVDPKLPGVSPLLQDLAGVGVAFKVCHGFLKYARELGFSGVTTDLRDGLDLVALGTVADIVPLLGENRCLVNHGLSVLSRQHRPGIRALCELAGVRDNVLTSDITYRLAPRINAAGRMGDPGEAYRLLLASNTTDAYRMAASLDQMNKDRQNIESEVLASAEAQITAKTHLDRDHTIVVAGEDWHQGVIGIVASRLVRKYHRPCVVLTTDGNGQYCGSGRSVRRVNLVSLLERSAPLLTRFGGHAMAAGLSLFPDNLQAFGEEFEESVSQVMGMAATQPQLDTCGALQFHELSDRVFDELSMLQPFGHGNPEPVFVSYDVSPDRVLPAGERHTRGTLRDRTRGRFSFIAFNRTQDELPPPPWNIAYTPHLNTYAGHTTPQLKIVDIQPAG